MYSVIIWISSVDLQMRRKRIQKTVSFLWHYLENKGVIPMLDIIGISRGSTMMDEVASDATSRQKIMVGEFAFTSI